MTQAQRETLERVRSSAFAGHRGLDGYVCRQCLKPEPNHEPTCLIHAIDALLRDHARQERDLTQANAVLEAVADAVKGVYPSDFMESFPPVRDVVDLKDSFETANQRLEEAQAKLAKAEAENARLQEEREKLRAALASLVGADGREELDAMEAAMRLIPAPAADKAASIDAIHALMATLPKAAALVTEEGQ